MDTTKYINYTNSIKKHDLGLLIARDWGDFPLLGFIGKDYQRFHIHFISATKDPKGPDLYHVKGKTKVKENICDFAGTMRITEAWLNIPSAYFPDTQAGFVKMEGVLNENKNQRGTGIIKGRLSIGFFTDASGKMKYDTLGEVFSDGYNNSQFTGTWTSYTTGKTKKCNWGNSRIPETEEIDIGAAYFSVDEKYVKNGWENYIEALKGDGSEVWKKAREKEGEKWWE